MFHTAGRSARTSRSLGATAREAAKEADAGDGEKRNAMLTVSCRVGSLVCVYRRWDAGADLSS